MLLNVSVAILEEERGTHSIISKGEDSGVSEQGFVEEL